MENTSNRIETCKINYRRPPLSSRFGESFSTIGIAAEDEDRSIALEEKKKEKRGKGEGNSIRLFSNRFEIRGRAFSRTPEKRSSLVFLF